VPVNYTFTWREVGCPTGYAFQATGSWWPVNACVPAPSPSSGPPPPASPPASPAKFKVPILRGMTLAQARQLLKLHFRVGTIHRVRRSALPIGRILRASPPGGSRQDSGTAINIWISH
jgi:hypothetical protein